MAGGVGIEPTYAVLETAVLPLYEPPTVSGGWLLFGFFVQSFLFAVLAEFLKFQTLLRVLLVLFALIIQIMANCAL